MSSTWLLKPARRAMARCSQRPFAAAPEREVKGQVRPLRQAMLRCHAVRIAGRLGLRSTLRKAYRFLLAPGGGEHGISLAGQTARFYIYSKSNIDTLDSLGGERPTLEFLLGKLQRGDSAYDVGAAIGLYTLFLAKAVGQNGQVIAFEPEEHTYERLCEHLRLNHLSNVRAFRYALGAGEETRYLRVGSVAGASRIIAPEELRQGGPVERIRVSPGDEFMAAANLPVPRVVKIDVEGYEFEVIRGLRRTLLQPQCEVVCSEVHPQLLPRGTTVDEVLDLLRSLGFVQIEIHPRLNDFHAWAVKVK